MIAHSRLLGPTGNRQLVRDSVGGSETRPLVVDLLQWATEKNEPQELEVLAYPLFDDPSIDPALIGGPLFYSVRVDLEWSAGAGEAGSSQRHATTQQTPPGDYTLNPSSATRTYALQAFPDHGVRFRVACRSMRLRLLVIGQASFIAVGSVTPCVGMQRDLVLPVVALFGVPHLIPYGAREFRVAAYPRTNAAGLVPDPTCVIQFNGNKFPSPFGNELQYPASDCLDWRVIPGEAHSVQTVIEAYGTIEYR